MRAEYLDGTGGMREEDSAGLEVRSIYVVLKLLALYHYAWSGLPQWRTLRKILRKHWSSVRRETGALMRSSAD